MRSVTRFTDLGSPRPRRREQACIEYTYSTISAKTLPRNILRPRRQFFQVVEQRRTRRSFGLLGERELSSFLWWCLFTREASRLPSGFICEHRPVPSAGGRHPIDLLVLQKIGHDWQVYLYEPMTHRLLLLIVNNDALQQLINQVTVLVPVKSATILWMVAQPRRTQSKYVNADSLIWRDAGVLIGHMALVAEALGLSFCPLGKTGEPQITRLLSSKEQAIGVGGCVLGQATGATRGSGK